MVAAIPRHCARVEERFHHDTLPAREIAADQDWSPNQLNLNALRRNSPASDPMGRDFNYAEAFRGLDIRTSRR